MHIKTITAITVLTYQPHMNKSLIKEFGTFAINLNHLNVRFRTYRYEARFFPPTYQVFQKHSRDEILEILGIILL